MGKAQQAGNEKAKRKREGRLVIVAELYKKGYSCRQISEEVMFQFTHPGGVRRYGAKLRIMGRINKRNLRLEVLL